MFPPVEISEAARRGNPYAQYRLAEECTQRGEYPEAKKWLLRSARKGNAEASADLGLRLLDGTHSFKKDINQAMRWLQRAAKKKVARAQYECGIRYLYERPLLKKHKISFKPEQGIQLLMQAAEQDYTPAHYMLGVMHLNGIGTLKNQKKAIKFFTQAADCEHSGALFLLGKCLWNGVGIKQNREKAWDLFQRATFEGNADILYGVWFVVSRSDCSQKMQTAATDYLCDAIDQKHPMAELERLDGIRLGTDCDPNTAFALASAYINSRKLTDTSRQSKVPVNKPVLARAEKLISAAIESIDGIEIKTKNPKSASIKIEFKDESRLVLKLNKTQSRKLPKNLPVQGVKLNTEGLFSLIFADRPLYKVDPFYFSCLRRSYRPIC